MKVVVAGSSGLVGTAVCNSFRKNGYEVIGLNRSVINLLNEQDTITYFSDINPEIVIDAAAKVGGINANSLSPVEFLVNNIQIQQNLMRASHLAKVKKFVFLGSSCIYPRDCQQPIIEEYLMTGPLEATNSAYAIAKISGIELVNAYRRQYGSSWISLMPTNLYGPGDNFELGKSHVLPALIRRFTEAVNNDTKSITLWGDGSPLREFLHVEDLAAAIVVATEKYDNEIHLNIGSGDEISIKHLALKIAAMTGYLGDIMWDSDMPNGTPRKLLNSDRMKSLGWKPQISLEVGLSSTIEWYQEASAKGEVRI
jgi:GDP-L-fucose synthase